MESSSAPDVDLKKVGRVADLPDNASPIQLSTEGRYGDKGFVVAAILYRYDQRGIVLDGGADGWLSDRKAVGHIFLASGCDIPGADAGRARAIVCLGTARRSPSSRARWRTTPAQLRSWDKAE